MLSASKYMFHTCMHGAIYTYGIGKIPIHIHNIPYTNGMTHMDMGQNMCTGWNNKIHFTM